MSAHPHFADDLALHALGALPQDEHAVLEKHLQECSACRQELEQVRGDMALFALSVAGPAPPRRARTRLLSALEREPRLIPLAPRRSWWLPAGWALAGAMLIFSLLLWRQKAELQQQAALLRGQSAQRQAELIRAREVVETLTATDAMQVTLVAAKTPPQPQGKVMYVPNRGRLLFMASNLPPAPPQKAYELWLIPMKGAPMPAGMFKPDAHGTALVMNQPMPPGTEARAFAITLEPEQGSSTPTMPIMMQGAAE